MAHETLTPIVENLPAIGIIFFAVSFSLKNRLKAKRPEIPPEQLEIHHHFPIFMGGNGDEENLSAVTKVEHALAHYHDAMSTKGDESQGHWWSVQRIIRRMSYEEVEEFNRLIKRRK